MDKKRRPIRSKVQKMVLTISVAALILAAAIGVFSMLQIKDDSERALIIQMEQNLNNITANKANLADSELGNFSDTVENFAAYIHELYTHPENYKDYDVLPADAKNAGILAMQRSLTTRDIKIDEISDDIKLLGNLVHIWDPVMRRNEGIITVVYIGTEKGFLIGYDKNSDTAAPKDGVEEYYDYTKSNWYTRAKTSGKVCFTNVYMDGYNRGLTITCAAPFYDADNKFAGVVGMDILISDLYRTIIDLDLGDDENSYAFLVDNDGKIIDNGETAKETTRLFHERGISPRVAAEILSGKTGVSLTPGRIYYAYTPIESTNWKFCIRMPESVILAPVKHVERNVIYTIMLFFAAFLMILIIVAVATRQFSKKLTDPIVSLNRDVEEISSGNLDYRVEIYDNDEIGDLAENFNKMAVSLKEYIKNLAAVTAEKERISAELNVATQIQADMLPRIFPPFPERKEFDIYASMTPAKEVGGDFYDFFLIDENHLGLVIADVSGKGVPAALFMVIAKTLIKNRALMGGTPSEILRDVNNQLCEGNDADLFVTVWLGILDIKTGKVMAANAGHEYPALKRVNEASFGLIKTKHSPAVATMEGMKFRENEFDLRPGDVLYLYTDGVAEATNSADELYGTDRMIEDLNKNANATVNEILVNMKRKVDDFTGEAPQFDDITMLCLQYFGKEDREELSILNIDAEVNNLDKVLAFVDEKLESYGCSPKTQMQIDVAVEEIFVNIASYAYNPEVGPAVISVETQEDPLAVIITFMDGGVPYNPLEKPDPDVTLSAEERQIGGLGIYMVKKSMDNVTYKYEDGKNILTITKNF